jgi:hypothetical protein
VDICNKKPTVHEYIAWSRVTLEFMVRNTPSYSPSHVPFLIKVLVNTPRPACGTVDLSMANNEGIVSRARFGVPLAI